MLSSKDCEVLRGLAKRYADIATLPVQKEKRDLWISLNRRKMQRPMVLIDQIPWDELNTDGILDCQISDPYWRMIEETLRHTLYQWEHMAADMVLNPYLCLPRPISDTGWGIDIDERRIDPVHGEAVSSHQYHNQIQGMDDVERINTPRIILDEPYEQELIQEAHFLFDGIIDFKMTGRSFHLGIWDWISQWMGVENCYIALMDEPEMIHALMKKLTTGVVDMIRQLNDIQGFDIDSNVTHCSHTFMPDMPKEGDLALSGNAWAFGMAQLFSSVSPKVTAEFELDYVKRIFPYFGAIYYGCCERLDDRMEIIGKIPKVRKISCSPWSDREHFAQVMPDYCIMSNKPNPALLASDSFDEDAVRRDIRRTITAAGNYNRNLELILKDISTVKGKPERLWRWCSIAMEEVQR